MTKQPMETDMKKLALALCMVPGIGFAQNFTESLWAEETAYGASTYCITDMENFHQSIFEVLVWVMEISNHGGKQVSFRGCPVPITNTQAYRDVRDDLQDSGYVVNLNNSTNVIVVSWR